MQETSAKKGRLVEQPYFPASIRDRAKKGGLTKQDLTPVKAEQPALVG